MCAEEGRKLVETVQATAVDHIQELIRREGELCGLYSARAMLEETHEHERLADMGHAPSAAQCSRQYA